MEGKTPLHEAPGSSHSKLHKSLAAVLRPPHKRRAGANQTTSAATHHTNASNQYSRAGSIPPRKKPWQKLMEP